MAAGYPKGCPLDLSLSLLSIVREKQTPISISQSVIPRQQVVWGVFLGDGDTRAWERARGQMMIGPARSINTGAAIEECRENVLSRETPTPRGLQLNTLGVAASHTAGRPLPCAGQRLLFDT